MDDDVAEDANNDESKQIDQDENALKVFSEDDLMAESHIGLENLLTSLFKFRAKKNSRMLSSMSAS